MVESQKPENFVLEERVEQNEEEIHLRSMTTETKPVNPENKKSIDFYQESHSEAGDEFNNIKDTPHPPHTLQEKIAEKMKERQIEKEISQKDITKLFSEQPDQPNNLEDDQLHINLSDKPKHRFKKKKIKRVIRNKQRVDSNKEIPSISNKSSGRVPEIVEEEMQSPNINQVKLDNMGTLNNYGPSVRVNYDEKIGMVMSR